MALAWFLRAPLKADVVLLPSRVDLDADGDADIDDGAFLRACTSGATVAPASFACGAADLDRDGDVDQDDFGIFQRCADVGDRLPRTASCRLHAIGLSPRTFDGAGFTEAFERASRLGQVGLVQVPFAWDAFHGRTDYPTYTRDYDWLIGPTPPDDRSLFERHRLHKAFWLNFLNPSKPSTLNLAGDMTQAAFTNPQLASAFVEECVWLADRYRPDFLALGTEIDSYLAVISVQERDALLVTLRAAHDAIKRAHPRMVVFVYFQYENVRRGNLWDVIRPFAEFSDLYAFSSYPAMPVSGTDTGFTAATLPADYYASISARLGTARAQALVELGHPARPSSVFNAGSESEQAAFIRRVADVLPSQMALVVWTYLYDPVLEGVYTGAGCDLFDDMGLLRRDAPGLTPAHDAWQALGS